MIDYCAKNLHHTKPMGKENNDKVMKLLVGKKKKHCENDSNKISKF